MKKLVIKFVNIATVNPCNLRSEEKESQEKTVSVRRTDLQRLGL